MHLKTFHRDFPGGPMVKTHASTEGGVGSIPGGEVLYDPRRDQDKSELL